jgi:hypothetical protein
MTTRRILCLGLLALAIVPASAADVRLGPYRNPETEGLRDLYRAYLDGVKGGLMASNAWHIRHGGQQTFCLPEHLALSTAQAEDIMLASAKKRSAKDDWPVAALLLSGLQDAYPCEKPAPGTDVK